MDKVQKIKEEIERRISQCERLLSADLLKRERDETLCVLHQYKQILQFIDSLQEEHINFPHERNIVDKVFGAGNLESWEYEEAEKLVLLAKEELLKDLEKDKEPASEDLEEEIQRAYYDKSLYDADNLDRQDFNNIARHFAEWQREKDIKLEKIKDLEEFAQKWAYSNYHKELDEVNCDCLYSGVIKGAEWQKQKDLEDSLKSDMTMPNKFYEKGKADAMNEMKETLQTEYEKGRFDMREEMMKDTQDAVVVIGSDGKLFAVPILIRLDKKIRNKKKVKLVIIDTNAM